MNRYTKVIGISGVMYVKEYEKIKHHKNKIREISELTVIKEFKKGRTEVLIYNEETGNEFLVDDFADTETIKKYLGKKFL